MAEKNRMQGVFDAFDRLSTREKLMVGGLAGAFGIFVIAIIWMIFANQISGLEQRNQGARDTLAEVMTLKDPYLAQKAQLDAKKSLLDNNNVRLVRLMETEAKREGIDIENFKESKRYLTENHRRRRPEGEGEGGRKRAVTDLVEVSQTVTIRRISLDQLSNFMAALEKRPQPIKITDLKISTLSSDRQVLREVRMKVSTYRNEEVQL